MCNQNLASTVFHTQDFNFVLRNEHNVLRNTIAINKSTDLQKRAMEHES